MEGLRSETYFIDVSGHQAANGKRVYNMTYHYVTEFERQFDHYKWINYFNQYWKFAIVLLIFYVILIHSVQHWMKERPKYDLRYVLVAWNISLAVFSLAGFIRVFSELRYVLSEFGFHSSTCLSGHR